MIPIDVHSIDDFDWRLQSVMGIESIKHGIGPAIKTGGFATLAGGFNLGGQEIIFDIPNMSAVLLEYSNNLFRHAEHYFIFSNFPRNHKNRVIGDYNEFMDIIQSRIGCVIFSFLALETFMNDSIGDGYVFDNTNKIIKTRKGSPILLDKDFITDSVTIKSKFEFILPDIYKIAQIDPNILQKFTELRNLRDRLTHLKQVDKSSGDSSKDTIWKALLTKTFQNYAIVTKEIIKYFLETLDDEKLPRWFTKIPF